MSMFLPLMTKTLFSWSLLLVLLPIFLEKIDASETKFQTLDTSPYHLSPTSDLVCNRASKTGFKNRPTTTTTTTVLEVVHKNNPCAPNVQKQPKLSFAKILENDQLRVKSIQARVVIHSINTNKLDTNKSMSLDKEAQLPAQSGWPLDSGNYVVTIGLGTPKTNLTLVFDTGSFLTLTQCQPCDKKHCYRQKDPMFNPHRSTSYSNISCNSKHCPQNDSLFGCYHNITCAYGMKYFDGSYNNGYLSKEKLTITPKDVFPNFLFGGGHNNSGLFGKTDGLLGLSKGSLSIVSQTAKTYGQYFYYCLPSNIHSSGFLAFGRKDDHDAKNMISTPLVQNRSGSDFFYFIDITGISVGGTRLPISVSVIKKVGTIIDSGTVITRFPTAAYNELSKEFKKQMNKNYKSAPSYSILDTCFRITNNTTKVPIVSFTFRGSKKRLDLDASRTLWVTSPTHACLAFAGNSDPSDVAIFGNTQQKKFEVVYDVAGKKLSFNSNPNCQCQ